MQPLPGTPQPRGGLVRIVVACSARKSRPASPGLRARDLPKGMDTLGRAKEWVDRLTAVRAGDVRVADLYRGDSWKVASTMPDEANRHGWEAQRWIVSAGYGLVSDQSPVCPYDATFASGHTDSVVLTAGRARQVGLREWWRLLGEWEGPDPGAPRSLTSLAAESPTSPLVVTLGETYLQAVRDDLVKARRALASPTLLTVVSIGTKGAPAPPENVVRIAAASARALGGSLASLNARVARWVLSTADQHAFDAPRVILLAADTFRVDVGKVPQRQRQSDSAILAFIKNKVAAEPTPPKSILLRDLRRAGLACEQGRFYRLYARAAAARPM